MIEKLKRNPHWIIAALLFLMSFIIYERTIAPTTSFWDSGEYIACSYILGIPHPPGNPLYILIGRLFSMIPYGEEVARRVNLLSAVMTAISVMLTYLIMIRLTRDWMKGGFLESIPSHVAGITAALFFGFSFTTWTNAIESEVYGSMIFFMALIFWLILYWEDRLDNKYQRLYILLIVYLFSLGFGIHQTILVIIPALIIFIMITDYRTLLDTRLWFLILLFAVIGYTVHAYLIVRTQVNPGIDEADPYNLQMFGYYIQRKQYRPYRMFERSAPFSIQFQDYLKYHSWQYFNFEQLQDWYPQISEAFLRFLKKTYGFLVVFLGLLGGLVHWFLGKQEPEKDETSEKSYFSFDYYVTQVFTSNRYFLYAVFLLILLGTPNPNPFHNLLFNSVLSGVENWTWGGKFAVLVVLALIGPSVVFFIIATGAWIGQYIRKYRYFILLTLLVFITTFGFVFIMNLTDQEVRDRDYFWSPTYMIWSMWMGLGLGGILYIVMQFLSKTPVLKYGLGIILGIFMIGLPVGNIYSQYHSHDRTDDYVAHDYGLNILESCEPNAILFTNGDNDTFPLWFLQEVKRVRRDVTVANLSLLNTTWYIKQLRDEWGCPFSFSERELSYDEKTPGRLYPYRTQREMKSIAGMRVHVPGAETDIMTIKDMAVYNIIQTNAEWACFLNQEEYDLFQKKYPQAKSIIKPFEIPLGPKVYIDVNRIPDAKREVLGEAYTELSGLTWRHPIYFAVTVADLMDFKTQGYLSIEGLVFHLDPDYKAQRKSMDAEKLEQNMWDTYKYRGLIAIDGDESPYQEADYRKLLAEDRLSHAYGVYKDDNATKLTSNYAAGFSRLANHFRSLGSRESDPEKKKEYQQLVLDQFKMASIVAPQFAQLKQGLAIAYEDLGMYEEAVQAWTDYIEEQPNEFLPYQGKSEVLRKMGNRDEAIAVIESFIVRYPANLQGYVALGEAYKDMGDIDGMITAYERGVDVTNDTKLYQNILSNLISAKNYVKANEVLKNWQRRDPNNQLIPTYEQFIAREMQTVQDSASN